MGKTKHLSKGINTLYDTVNQIIKDARNTVYQTANFTMVKAYWNIGKAIVEEEQNGKERAEYGSFLIKNLSIELTLAFGKGFSEQSIKNFRP